MRVRLLKLFATSLFILFLPHLILAQTTNGSIRGTVTDQNGAVMPNAAVIVKNVETGFERRLTTREEGTYLADNLPPGEYEIQIESRGFQKQ
ncbi:MAG: carboxypeptidase-like regulatory domain-containing protein, partial [Blastocatellia bacterium]